MTKKAFFRCWMLLALSAATVAITSCDKEDNFKGAISNDVNGVVINGVRWATRNVGESGTFVDKPEQQGEFYQLDKLQSPDGWRIPTPDELNQLLNEEKVTNEWKSVNGVSGRVFTDRATGISIFFPAAGYRGTNKAPFGKGEFGHYWSSTDSTGVNTLYFDDKKASLSYYDYDQVGHSVRLVAE